MLNDLAALYADNPALFAGTVFVFGLVHLGFSPARMLNGPGATFASSVLDT